MNGARRAEPTWVLVLVAVLVAVGGYGLFEDPPFGTVGSLATSLVLVGLAIRIGKRGRRPGAVLASGLVVSYSAQALLASGAARNVLAGGLWVALTYLLCDRATPNWPKESAAPLR